MSTLMTVGLMRKRQLEALFAMLALMTVGLVPLGLLTCDVDDGVGGCGKRNGDDDGSKWTVCGVRWVVVETDKGGEEEDGVVVLIEAWVVWDALFHRGL
jgi:hypothetical protein